MRFIEKLLYGIVGILGVILLLIVMCHFNPSLAENIGNSVQAKETEAEKVKEAGIEIAAFPKESENGLSEEMKPSGYIAPDEEKMEISARVAALSGYTPIVEKGKQISYEKAAQILDVLDVGNVGNDLQYDEKFYPYYYMLNDRGKDLYRQIHGNTNDLVQTFKPVMENVNAKELKNAFAAVCNDHPELFWLNTAYSYKYAPSGNIAEINLSFNYTANDLEESKATFDQAAKEIIYGSRGLKSKYDEEVYVHNSLAKKITYDLNAPINQSAYSALVQNRTVCAGYARAFQYIMQQLENPCYYCAGYAGQNHAWNILKLDGDYYNVDVTWDDTNPMTFDYFNCSDATYAKDHARRELSIYLPPCNGTKYSDLEENEEERIKREQEEIKKQQDKLKKEEDGKKNEEEEKKDDMPSAGNGEQLQIDFKRLGESDHIIFTNIEDYFTDCAQAMMDDNDNSISFYNFVADEKLWNQIKKAYEKGDYSNAYMERVLADKHKSNCQAKVTGQKLDDGTYVIRHVMILK